MKRVDYSDPASAELTAAFLPKANARPFVNLDAAIGDTSVTAILTTLERAYYWSRVHPEFAAVRPEGLTTATVTVYAMPYGESDLKNLVDLWIETRRVSGEIEEAYDYWVRGKALASRTPRWSVLGSLFDRAGY